MSKLLKRLLLAKIYNVRFKLDMEETILKILEKGKGILAADESTPSITKRFAAINLVSNPELNKKYREMLFSTPDLEKYISGVILFDETIKQGLGQILTAKGILVGIKVDGGLENFNDTEEQVTKGLDGLAERLIEYKKLGATFTKWRGVIKISDIFPTDPFLDENLGRMAKYAKLVQSMDMVPIVEPEVLLDGNHTTTRCAEISTKTLKRLFEILISEGVDLNKVILKTNMVLPGKDSGITAEPLEVAGATLRTFNSSIPNEVPGIVFLSGGQTPDQATNNLNEIVKTKGDSPWDISFSYGRALQEEAMKDWGGKDENVVLAQETLIKRAEAVSRARMGGL